MSRTQENKKLMGCFDIQRVGLHGLESLQNDDCRVRRCILENYKTVDASAQV